MSEEKPSNIYQKMVLIMKDLGPVKKEGKNTQVGQGYYFRGIDQFINALHPLLGKHEVFIVPRVIRYESQLKDVTRASTGKQGIDKHVLLMVEFDFMSSDGSLVTIGPIASEGIDSSDKATNKALSAALKYGLIQTFAVPTADMEDGDKDTPEIGIVRVPIYEEERPSVTVPKTIPTPKLSTTNPKDYFVQGGRYKGKKLSEIPAKDLDSYLGYLTKDFGPETLTGKTKEFYDNGAAYLKSLAGN